MGPETWTDIHNVGQQVSTHLGDEKRVMAFLAFTFGMGVVFMVNCPLLLVGPSVDDPVHFVAFGLIGVMMIAVTGLTVCSCIY